MAHKGNKQESRTNYIGFLHMKVSKVEFERNEDKEKSFVVVTLVNEKHKVSVKASFYVEGVAMFSEKKNKFQYADPFGRFQWAEEGKAVTTDYFTANGQRKAGVGEEALSGFISALINTKKGDQSRFESWKKISSGDLTEITELVDAYKENEVGVLLGIKGGKYQAVYLGRFERGWVTDTKNMVKAVEKDETNTLYFGKAPYPFKEFEVNSAPTSTSEDLLEKESNFIEETNFVDTSLDDDLPF